MKAAVSSFANSLDASWSEERVRAELVEHAELARSAQDELLNDVAIELARRFDQQSLSHAEAMAKVAALYNAVFGHAEVPRQLYDVYWALDEAEYGSERDDSEEEFAPERRAREGVRAILAAVPR